jgi:hypothetical protein
LVISGEALSNLPQAGVERFSSWLSEHANEIFVIAYVRHPVDWSSSFAQQLIKGGRLLHIFDSRPPLPRLRERLAPWMAAFGRDKIVLADYQTASQHPLGLIGHFADLIGVADAFDASASIVHANESLSTEAILILDALNRMRQARCSTGEVEILRRIKGRKFRLSEPALAAVRTRSRADLDWLDEHFGLCLTESASTHAPEPLFADTTIRSLAKLVIEFGDQVAAQPRPRAQRKLPVKSEALVP